MRVFLNLLAALLLGVALVLVGGGPTSGFFTDGGGGSAAQNQAVLDQLFSPGEFDGEPVALDPPGKSPQSVIGSDGRVQIESTTGDPWRKIVFLETSNAAGDYTCSGAIIGPQLVLTAAHCLYDAFSEQWMDLVIVTPGQQDAATFPYGFQVVGPSSLSVSGGYLLFGLPEYDWGVVRLPDTTLWNQVGAFPYSVASDAQLSGSQGKVAGYPGDKPYGTMWYDDDEITAASEHLLSHEIDATGGQSGAPIWVTHGTTDYIVGLHAYGTGDITICTFADNCGTRLTGGMADTLEAHGANSRVAIPSIVTASPTPPPAPTSSPTPTPTATATLTATATGKPTATATRTGTPSPSSTASPTTGPENRWLDFDGPASGYLEIPHHPSLSLSDELTVEARVFLETRGGFGSQTDCPTIVGKNWTQSFALGLVCGADAMNSWVNGSEQESTTELIPTREWVHLAFSYDGSKRRHFIDGEMILEIDDPLGHIGQTNDPLRIGSDVEWDYSVNGRIDDVRIWNRALTEGEFLGLSAPLSNSAGLVASWSFDAGTSSDIGGFVGTLQGNVVIAGSSTPTTPSQTLSPTPTTAGVTRQWSDADCDGEMSTRDNQSILRIVLQQNPLSQTQPCFSIGGSVGVPGHGNQLWADADCDGEITTRDNQAVMREVLQQNALSQSEPCPDVGSMTLLS